MTASETTSYVLGQLLLPPTSLILLALAGLLLAVRQRAAGIAVAGASLLLLLALSTTVVALALMRTLEPPPLDAARADAEAIVILAGGRVSASPEWHADTVNAATLRRIRYGAQLARETGLPILLSGGNPDRAVLAEARLMQQVLEREFGVPARWVEDGSDTTADNAWLSAAILRPLGIGRVLLVTDAYHMPRALRVFALAGLSPVPAPTGYAGRRPFRAQQLVPNAEALALSNVALREWAARLWYQWRHS